MDAKDIYQLSDSDNDEYENHSDVESTNTHDAVHRQQSATSTLNYTTSTNSNNNKPNTGNENTDIANDHPEVMNFSSDDDIDTSSVNTDISSNIQHSHNHNNNSNNTNQTTIHTTASAISTTTPSTSNKRNDDIAAANRTIVLSIIGIGTVENTPNKRRKSNIRYYGVDSSLKCWNCMESGHLASMCPHERIHPVCYICGQRSDHKPSKCINDLCYLCYNIGHGQRECPNPNKQIVLQFCYKCGSTTHTYETCDITEQQIQRDIKHVRCYVCGNLGHISCAVNPLLSSSPSRRDRNSFQQRINGSIYCANCSDRGHTFIECTRPRLRDVIPINNRGEPHVNDYQADSTDDDQDAYTASMRVSTRSSRRIDNKLCYICNSAAHLAKDCPHKHGQGGGQPNTNTHTNAIHYDRDRDRGRQRERSPVRLSSNSTSSYRRAESENTLC
jgi:hypothetical protein